MQGGMKKKIKRHMVEPWVTARVFGWDGVHVVKIALLRGSSIPEVATVIRFKGQTYVQISTTPLTYRWVESQVAKEF
jgi:hypothetical protein